MNSQLFIILFFPSLFISLGIFFIGVGYVWRVSLQDKEMKRQAKAGSNC